MIDIIYTIYELVHEPLRNGQENFLIYLIVQWTWLVWCRYLTGKAVRYQRKLEDFHMDSDPEAGRVGNPIPRITEPFGQLTPTAPAETERKLIQKNE